MTLRWYDWVTFTVAGAFGMPWAVAVIWGALWRLTERLGRNRLY